MSALRDWFRRRPSSAEGTPRPAYELHPWQQPFQTDPQSACVHGPTFPYWPAQPGQLPQLPPPPPPPPLQRLNTQEMEANQVGLSAPALTASYMLADIRSPC
jgi:hypothetical protein